MSAFLREVGRDLFDAAVAEGEAKQARAAKAPATTAPAKTATELAAERVYAKGVYATHHAVRERARAFIRRPMEMHPIDARLPGAGSRQMIAIAEHHLDLEARRDRRRLGLGGEVPLANAKAVLVAGRYLRRSGGDIALVAAE